MSCPRKRSGATLRATACGSSTDRKSHQHSRRANPRRALIASPGGPASTTSADPALAASFMCSPSTARTLGRLVERREPTRNRGWRAPCRSGRLRGCAVSSLVMPLLPKAIDSTVEHAREECCVRVRLYSSYRTSVRPNSSSPPAVSSPACSRGARRSPPRRRRARSVHAVSMNPRDRIARPLGLPSVRGPRVRRIAPQRSRPLGVITHR